jgi:hypothetical protein
MLLSALVGQYETETARGLTGRRARMPWSRHRLVRRLKWRIAACSFALIGLLQIAAWWDGAQSRKSPSGDPATAPPPIWIEIVHPAEIFRLDAPDFAELSRSYKSWQHRTGGGRQDILEFGRADDAVPKFRLVIYRPGNEPVLQQSFFVELARRAAETGRAITRLTQPGAMATKFGDFEVAELGLAHGGGPARECLGFRFAATAPDLRVAGFACGAAPSFMTKARLACLIDRLELAPSPEDEKLIWFFAAHETTGASPCQGPAPIQTAGRAAGEQAAALGLRGVGAE